MGRFAINGKDKFLEGSREISKSKLWRNYLDDVFAILPKSQVQNYLLYIQSLNNDIQLKVETEQNLKLPFLDLLIFRDPSGNLSFDVYRKPAHTNNH